VCIYIYIYIYTEYVVLGGWEMVTLQKSTSAIFLNSFCSTVKLLSQQIEAWIDTLLTDVLSSVQLLC